MWRLIFLGIIIGLGFYIFKRILNQTESSTVVPESNLDKAEDMVQCVTCAVHLPRSEAFLVKGKFYCSQTHISNK
ncbi:MAG: PP0621 family protein [Methylophilaceae bacterium]|jgi:uncharacterized protein